jgi:hypothetical protein
LAFVHHSAAAAAAPKHWAPTAELLCDQIFHQNQTKSRQFIYTSTYIQLLPKPSWGKKQQKTSPKKPQGAKQKFNLICEHLPLLPSPPFQLFAHLLPPQTTSV